MIAAFVLAAILAAGILKVLGYVECSWWLIASPLLAWAAFQVVAILIYLWASSGIEKFKKENPPRPVPKSGFMKRMEKIERAHQEALERQKLKNKGIAD